MSPAHGDVFQSIALAQVSSDAMRSISAAMSACGTHPQRDRTKTRRNKNMAREQLKKAKKLEATKPVTIAAHGNSGGGR
jgi:hypothetical protein